MTTPSPPSNSKRDCNNMNVALACSEDSVLHKDNLLLLAALTSIGGGNSITARLLIWNDTTIDWREFDCVMVRTGGDCRVEEIARWCTSIARHTMVLNPPGIIDWSLHSHLLDELAARGVRVIPTLYVPETPDVIPSSTVITAALAIKGWSEAVIQPHRSRRTADALEHTQPVLISTTTALSSSGGGFDEQCCASSPATVVQMQRIDTLRHITGTVKVQPFPRTVLHEGDLSFVFAGGMFCHCVNRVPVPGDFRTCGAPCQIFKPTDDVLFFAINAYQAVCAAIRDVPPAQRKGTSYFTPTAPAYGRIDVRRGIDGSLAVSDVELVDPDLYLDCSKDSARLVAEAVVSYARSIQPDAPPPEPARRRTPYDDESL